MPDESIWIGIIIIGLFVLAEMVSWVRTEHRKWHMKHEPEQAIEKPGRIKVMSYNKDKSLNYWEGGRR